MAVRDHVRAFVTALQHAPAWDPRPFATRLESTFEADLDGLATWVATVDGLRVGHGCVAMHRRHAAARPALDVPGLDDFEALLLCAGSLRLGALMQAGYAPDGDALLRAVPAAEGWLTNLLRMEPDFLDELLLEVAARRASDPELHAALVAQAELLTRVGGELHTQGRRVLGGRRGISEALRSLVGAGPNLAKGEWARWARAIVVLGLLDAKG